MPRKTNPLDPDRTHSRQTEFKYFDNPASAVKSPHSIRPVRVSDNHPDTLTAQERNIALLVSEGKTNTEIAGTLYLTHGTVKNYVSTILAKLQLTNRAALAVYAIQHDLRTGIVDDYTATPSDPDCYKDLIFMAYV